MLIHDRLVESTKSMKKLSKAESTANDLKKRKNNDASFHNLVMDFQRNMKTYQYANQHLSYQLPEDLRQRLKIYMQSLRSTIDDNSLVDEDCLSRDKSESKLLATILKEQWKIFYDNKLTGYNGSLDILNGLGDTSLGIDQLRNRLEAGRNWETLGMPYHNGTKEIIVVLAETVTWINSLLNELDLTDGVKTFLRAVSQNWASMALLTPEVYDWIHKKGIGVRFSIAFKKDNNNYI